MGYATLYETQSLCISNRVETGKGQARAYKNVTRDHQHKTVFDKYQVKVQKALEEFKMD